MPPKGGANVADVLANFRKGMVKAQAVKSAAAKEREERLNRTASSNAVAKKAAPARSARSRVARAATTTTTTGATSSGPNGSADGSGVPAPSADWRAAAAATAAQKALLPLGMRQKQVVDFLRSRESPATAQDILAATGRDPREETDLAASLDANPKVAVVDEPDTRTYAYVSDANVRNRDQLLDYVRRSGAPVAFSEVADAYRTVADDVAALKQEGLIMVMHSFDPEVGCDVLFAVDPRLSGLAVDGDGVALWAGTAVPEDEDEVAAELRKAGLTPAPRSAPRQRAAAERKKKKRQRRQAKLRAVTNVHLMHLLEGDAPMAIDNVDAC